MFDTKVTPKRVLASFSLILALCLVLAGSTSVVSAGSSVLTLSDAELSTQFAKEWGPASVTITDIADPGVRFDFSGLSPTQGTGVGDNFPVSQLAGGAWKTYPEYGGWGTYGDFSGYTQYTLVFTNVGDTPVMVNLKMNTGWIDSPRDGTYDTYWENDWVSLDVGETKTVTLKFSSATCYNAADDPVPEWRYPDGTTGVPVRRLDEVSNIGFQVLGEGEGSIVVSAWEPQPSPPPTVPEFGLPMVAVTSLLTASYVLFRRRLK